jgi:DNA ligase-1
VVLAAEWGSGRRQGWLSNLHLGARDPERGGFVMLGKTFKGMTDEILRWQTEACWRASWAARASTVTCARSWWWRSPSTTCRRARSTRRRGPALRRLRRYRPDKRAEDADSIAAVRALLPAAGEDPPGAGD